MYTKCAIITNIQWDADGHEDELPTKYEVDFPDNIPEFDLSDDEREELVSEFLTSMFHFCHNGFDIQWVTI